MKLKILSLFLILIFFSNKSFSLENRIIVKINKNIITSVDILNESKYLNITNSNFENLDQNKIYKISKDSLIREKIKENELLKNFKNLNIDQEYFDKFFSNYVKGMGYSNVNEFKNLLIKSNLNLSTIEKKIRIEILWNQLIIKKFLKDIKIDEKIIKSSLEKKTKINEYDISEIVFKIENKNQLNEKLKIIEDDIYKKGFNNAALIHSISDTAKKSGKLGWIKETSLNSKIRKELENVKIGKFTKPILIPGGFLILNLNNKRVIKREIDVEKEIKQIVNEKTNDELNRMSTIYLNKVKKNFQIYEL